MGEMAQTVTMKMSSLRGSMAGRWQGRLVLPLSLSLAGVLAPAHGQSPEDCHRSDPHQDMGVSFQKNVGASTGGTLSLGTNTGSAAAVTSSFYGSGGVVIMSRGRWISARLPRCWRGRTR